ncbi:MAG: hypothetical protein IJK77_04530 [Lachnospiraceae bacterium]|nr:hypothetical protein [Lachnospiraceae bacterium]
MSQQKVDKYKEFKKNRKEELEKERKAKKRTELIWKIVGLVLAAGLVVALAITGINAWSNWKQAQPVYTRDSLIIGDIAGISETEEETTEAVPESTEEAVPSPESDETGAETGEAVPSPESDETGAETTAAN